MALTPTTPTESPADKRKERAAAQEDVLMREVDEAVRQDELSGFLDKYGKPLLAVVVFGLAIFGGYLIWDGQNEAALEQESETLTRALDQIEAGNVQSGSDTLADLAANGQSGPKATAALLRGGIALEQGNAEEAASIFAAVAADEDAPQAYRDLAVIREVAASFDTMAADDIVTRLTPLAVAENAYFGSAGEMLALAYLEQGKEAEAGALLAKMAQDEDIPESIRARARQMAGQFGVDSIEDVEEVLEQSRLSQPQNGPQTAPQAPPQVQ